MRQRSNKLQRRLQSLGCCVAALCLLLRQGNCQESFLQSNPLVNPLAEKSASDRPSITQLTSTVAEIESSSNSLEILIKATRRTEVSARHYSHGGVA